MPSLRPGPLALALALVHVLALAPLAAAQTVHTVDAADPLADFATIQAAVDAAAPGDVVLVRPGLYAPFDVVGKGVTVVGDGEPLPIVRGPVEASTCRVVGVPAGQVASLAGLRFRPVDDVGGGTTGELLDVSDNAGLVWLEELRLEAIPPPIFGTLDQQQGLRIANSARVVVVASVVQGQHGSSQSAFGSYLGFGQEYGARAVHVANADAFFLGSEVEGGSTDILTTLGVEGLLATDALVVLRSTTVRGGSGGPGQSFPPPTFVPGQGGPGVELEGASILWTIGGALLGGHGGGDAFSGQTGPVGVPLVQAPLAAHTDHPANTVQLAAPVVVREAADLTLVVTAQPGSPVFLLAAFATQAQFLPFFPEVTGVGLAPVLLPLPPTDASGTTQLAIGAPFLPPGLDAFAWTLQAAALTAPTGLELSEPSRVVGLQSRF